MPSQRRAIARFPLRTLWLALFCAAALSGCGSDLCGSNSAAIARFRQLPEVRLAGLFADLSALPVEYSASGQRIPAQFRDLEPIGVFVPSKNTRMVHLSGCMDDKIILFLESAQGSETPDRIRMSLGDGKGSEIVWSSR